VQTLLTARLDGLPAGERSLLGVGSVIGRSFEVGSAAVLSGADAREVAASLHDLVRKDLVRPEHGAQDDLFRFRHVLIMQAAYEMVPKATRADLHRAVADRLETRSGDQAASDEMIGDHLARAAAYLTELGADGEGVQPLRTRAGQHLAAGGRRAYARSDMAAAASLFGRARDLLDPDDDTRVSFLADLAGAYIELGRFEDADRTFAEAIERGSAHGMSHVVADAVLFRFEAQLWSGNHDAAAVSAERARELIAEGEARDDLFAQQRGWSVLGIWADTWEEQTAFTQRAMALAEEVGDTKGVYENIQMLCGLLVEGPTPVDEGLKTTEEFRRRTAEDRVMQAAIIVNARAQLLAMSGHLEESREEYRWARQTFRDLGLSLWLSASGTIGPSVSELTAGDPAIAEAMLVEGIAGLKRIDARGTWLNVNLGLLASALVRQGRLDDARAAMAERATVVPDDDPWQRVLQGATSLLAGDVEAAVELLRMETPRGGEGWLGAAALVRSSLAAALRAAGREDEAREVAQGALDLYQRKGDVASARRLREFLDGT
jgi:tetratricopeptide (TPR) repeat protein